VNGRRPSLSLLTCVLVVASVLAVQPAGATPTPALAAALPGYVTPVTAGNLAEIVVDANGTAYATNPYQNRVEVLTVATGALGAPIAVGTEPHALDLSADGRTLYVANVESHDVSVVDLVARREVRRIALPAGRPTSIAVANNGTALVTRWSNSSATGAPLLQVDLAAGTVRERSDRFSWTVSAKPSNVKASRDRTRIAVAVGVGESGRVAFYDAATDTFTAQKGVGPVPMLAVDASGSTLLAGGTATYVVGRDLSLHATVPGPDVIALALSGSGTTGYRLKDGVVEVLDVERAVVAATITLSDPAVHWSPGLALTSDDATLVVSTMRGFSVVPTAAAVPTTCARPAAPAGVVAICGAPLVDVVIDGRNRAYASNPSRNQIEVVSLATRTLEAPIPVGSQPRSLALSADRTTLYVVNSGAEDVSVVDLAAGREVRRISVAVALEEVPDRPQSIAVASNGTALLTTRPLFSGQSPRLLQVDLATDIARPRRDHPVGSPQYLEASGDNSRIGVIPAETSPGKVAFYDADTDTFTPGKEVSGGLWYLALDRTGSKLLVGPGSPDFDPATYVLDGDLVRRATLPRLNPGIAVTGSGTIAYGVQWRAIDVYDLDRAIAVRSIPLAEPVGAHPVPLALSPDEATIAVVTTSGITVLPVSAAVAVPACVPAGVPASVAGVCGTAQGDVVTDAGHAYVSNPEYNRIEVVSLATGKLEAPIPVGSRPRGLDLSVDGATLYVANTGGEEISVVDVARRREIRRITVPSLGSNDRPSSIAVADNGKALVTTVFGGYGYGTFLVEVDLEEETSRRRSDFGPGGGRLATGTIVKASTDRSRIAVVDPNSGGEVTMYSAKADTFGPMLSLGTYLSAVALDHTGERALLNPGGFVTDGEPALLGSIPATPGGKGVAIDRTGTTGFRVQDTAVEILDMGQRSVVHSLPLPEPVGNGRGSISLAPDGATLAVVTTSGISLVKTPTATPGMPYASWSQPTAAPLNGLGSLMVMGEGPAAAAGQSPPSYLYGHYFGFERTAAHGVIGLMATASGRAAVFALIEPDGTSRIVAVPITWVPGHAYLSLVFQLVPGTWGGWVYDYSAATWTYIGQLSLSANVGRLGSASTTALTWFGAKAPVCPAYPRADVLVSPAIGFGAGPATLATATSSAVIPGGCAAQASTEVWARYTAGAATA